MERIDVIISSGITAPPLVLGAFLWRVVQAGRLANDVGLARGQKA